MQFGASEPLQNPFFRYCYHLFLRFEKVTTQPKNVNNLYIKNLLYRVQVAEALPILFYLSHNFLPFTH